MFLQKKKSAVLSIITFFLMSFVVTPFSVGAEENEPNPTITLNHESIFADSEFTKEIGKVTSEVEYPIVNENDDYVEVMIGNVIGYIKKEEAGKQQLEEEALNAKDSLENGGVESPLDTGAKSVAQVPQPIAIQEKKSVSIAAVSSNYFTVKGDTLSVYENVNGSLVKVGALMAGQVYPKVSTEGNWIKVKYGNGYGFVWKESTVDADPSGLEQSESRS